ncbi:MAG TPA: GNAT family protein [Bacteroidota bacterium]|nr:GNAT family protein [Bacteroidota bacterium]
MHSKLVPIVLEGSVIRLEPLTSSHLDALCAVGLDPELWKMTLTNVQTREDMQSYIEAALRAQEQGTALPFVIVERATGTVVGSTRYMNIDLPNRKLEIGSTWVAKQWQRTAVNTEAKYLLLRHAFEERGCLRVEFKTDVLNTQSRNALLRIGAKEEGVLRKHQITQTGRVRDSVYYSIIDTEWPEVKRRLEKKLGMQLA